LGASISAAMSVSMKLACTVTTSVPWSCSSTRIPLVKDQAAAFDAPEDASAGLVQKLVSDSMLTTVPPPLAASTGANARHMLSAPK
jgi:hypothetical protein